MAKAVKYMRIGFNLVKYQKLNKKQVNVILDDDNLLGHIVDYFLIVEMLFDIYGSKISSVVPLEKILDMLKKSEDYI